MSAARLLFLTVCFIGCGPRNTGPVASGHPARQQAEEELKKVSALDYSAPASGSRVEHRTKAADFFLKSCNAEADVSSCVWAVSLSASLPVVDEADYVRIRAGIDVLSPMCVAGNLDACRLFDGEVARSPAAYSNSDTACRRGLASACIATSRANANNGAVGGSSPAEISLLLDRACELGDPNGCEAAHHALADSNAARADLEQLVVKANRAATRRCERGYATSCYAIPRNGKRAAAAAADGCARGYLDECELPLEDDAAADRLLARACSLTGRGCLSLGDSRTNAIEKRDALEHGCQFWAIESCVKLVKGYRANAYPEPAVGRADALQAYLCTPSRNLPGDLCSEAKQ